MELFFSAEDTIVEVVMRKEGTDILYDVNWGEVERRMVWHTPELTKGYFKIFDESQLAGLLQANPSVKQLKKSGVKVLINEIEERSKIVDSAPVKVGGV